MFLFKYQFTPTPHEVILGADAAVANDGEPKSSLSTVNSPYRAANSTAPHSWLAKLNGCAGFTGLNEFCSPVTNHEPATCHARLCGVNISGAPPLASRRIFSEDT